MKFVNRVMLQGYLEVEKVVEVVLDAGCGLTSPVVHGWLWTDGGMERHQVVLADKPAIGLLELMRRINPAGGSALLRLNGRVFEVAQLDGKPFVAVEGRLLDGVVDVKYVTLLSMPEAGLLRMLTDHRLREIVAMWDEVREADRAHMYRLVEEIRAARRPLSRMALGQASPDGDGGGLTSTPPAPRRAAPEG